MNDCYIGEKMLDNKKLIKELLLNSQDLYKIARITYKYCTQEETCEEVSMLIPLTKQINELSDKIHFGLYVLDSGEDPDGGTSNEPFSLEP